MISKQNSRGREETRINQKGRRVKKNSGASRWTRKPRAPFAAMEMNHSARENKSRRQCMQDLLSTTMLIMIWGDETRNGKDK